MLRNVDLHNHSVASDGLLPPAEVIALAASGGCDAVALTDHDTTAGLAEAATAAAGCGVTFIPGVEISVTWPMAAASEQVVPGREDINPITIHVVGLGIDPDSPPLRDGLAGIRRGRDTRAQAMGADFERIGIHGLYEDAIGYAANRQMIGRTHFARALQARGLVNSVGGAFERYLVRGKPGHVSHHWAALTDAVRWIREAGGVAVLAHPGRYKLGTDERRMLLADFHAAGGAAIEVVTGSHVTRQYAEFAALAREFGFMASRGSDYHGPGESRFKPGTLPPLPPGLTPVWSVLPMAG